MEEEESSTEILDKFGSDAARNEGNSASSTSELEREDKKDERATESVHIENGSSGGSE